MPKKIKYFIARCPKCNREFKRRYSSLKNNPNAKWITCSKRCNFGLIKLIQYYGINQELQNAIDNNIIQIYEEWGCGHKRDYFYSWNGYKYIFAPEHPNATKNGFVLEHRIIAEQKLGRYLNKNEIVHHIDDNKTNNTPENLEIMTRSQHSLLHRTKEGKKQKIKKEKKKYYSMPKLSSVLSRTEK